MYWQKRHYVKISQYFSKPFKNFGGCINVKVDFFLSYATKADIKNISHIDTSRFSLKQLSFNNRSLTTEVDKLDIDKLVPVPVDLSK